MFKSKGFTAAFIILTTIALFLFAVLMYLVFGKGAEALTSAVFLSSVESSEEPDGPASESEDTTIHFQIRVLTESEEHLYPVMNEEITEHGILTIVKAGQNGEGITFHKKAEFDAADAEGNLVKTEGSFEIVSKIYVNSGGIAYPMYRTYDGYYVTSNLNYVSFEADKTTVDPDPKKRGVYGYDGTAGTILKVHAEDGNHLSFTIYTYTESLETPVLDNVIAKYDDFGAAHFEFLNQTETTTGTILFAEENGKMKATVRFDSPVMIDSEYVTEFEVLHSDKES